VFRALAHPTRRSIVLALRRGESAVGQILPNNLTSKAALSKHLRTLQQAGLIDFRRKGTRLMYHINRQALKPVEQFLIGTTADR
jgi:ArsR family transcriptional regulator